MLSQLRRLRCMLRVPAIHPKLPGPQSSRSLLGRLHQDHASILGVAICHCQALDFRSFNWVSLGIAGGGGCFIYFSNATMTAKAAFDDGWRLQGPYGSDFQLKDRQRSAALHPTRCFFHKGRARASFLVWALRSTKLNGPCRAIREAVARGHHERSASVSPRRHAFISIELDEIGSMCHIFCRRQLERVASLVTPLALPIGPDGLMVAYSAVHDVDEVMHQGNDPVLSIK